MTNPPFDKFEKAYFPEDAMKLLEKLDARPDTVWRNSRYQVLLRRQAPPKPDWPCDIIWLSIKRIDKEPIHDWRDLQRIKNELVGPEHEAVELYPKESRVVDGANQYHLWCLAEPGHQMPFGFEGGLKHDGESLFGEKQRPFEKEEKEFLEDLYDTVSNDGNKAAVRKIVKEFKRLIKEEDYDRCNQHYETFDCRRMTDEVLFAFFSITTLVRNKISERAKAIDRCGEKLELAADFFSGIK